MQRSLGVCPAAGMAMRAVQVGVERVPGQDKPTGRALQVALVLTHLDHLQHEWWWALNQP